MQNRSGQTQKRRTKSPRKPFPAGAKPVLLLVTVLAVSLAAVIVYPQVRRHIRLSQIRISAALPEDTDRKTAAILKTALSGIDTAAPEIDGAKIILREGGATAGSDILLTRAAYPLEKDRLLAIDPYIFCIDKRAAGTPAPPPEAPLSRLAAWLESEKQPGLTPLVIAGEHAGDFSTLILYLAGELLGERSYSDLLEKLSSGAAEATDGIILTLTPVLELLKGWTAAGILPYNWTNWDRLAVQTALVEGKAAAAFIPRSVLKSLTKDERFFMQAQRPPAGDGRLRYRLFGSGIALLPGDGPRSDAYVPALQALLSASPQLRIEKESGLSPVRLEGAPLNLQHRNAVRWFANAEEYVVTDASLSKHPAFSRLHTLLR